MFQVMLDLGELLATGNELPEQMEEAQVEENPPQNQEDSDEAEGLETAAVMVSIFLFTNLISLHSNMQPLQAVF
jgi:hypothetical protein